MTMIQFCSCSLFDALTCSAYGYLGMMSFNLAFAGFNITFENFYTLLQSVKIHQGLVGSYSALSNDFNILLQEYG
jgi:hypothetical protein